VTSNCYKVPAGNLSKLRADVAKLVRQADRIRTKGYECVDPSIVERETVIEPGPILNAQTQERGPDEVYVMVEMVGTSPKIGGWTFAASLQHEDGGTIVRVVPGVLEEGRLSSYRDAPSECEHCNWKRRRNDTYLLLSDAGEVKQVGSTCLEDFLGGKSIDQVAAYAELLAAVGAACEVAGGGRGEITASLGEFLVYVACAIREGGWVSRARARESFPPTEPTSDAAWSRGLFPSDDLKKHCPELVLRPTDADRVRASEALSWATAELEAKGDGVTDYEHNLRVVVRGGYVSSRMAGIAASLLPMVERELGRRAEREVESRRRAASEYVGEVKMRRVFELRVLWVVDLEGEFGVTHLHVMVDGDGNYFKWSTGTRSLDVGRTYRLRATVKKHEEYRGTKQTVIARCVEEVLDSKQLQLA